MKKFSVLCLTAMLSLAALAGNENAEAVGPENAGQTDEDKYLIAEAPVTDTASEYALLQDIVEQIRSKTDFEPEAAIVLGSGLNSLAEKLEPAVITIPYAEIRGLPVSTAPGHVGQFVFGYLENVPVVIMQGRVHCYEGYSSLQVVRPIRVMKMLGAETLILTNSSGGVNLDFKGGEIMMITNQILFGVSNPLIGANIPELGDRFPDMSNAYDSDLQELLRASAADAGVGLKEGTYLQDTGPSYETTAETKMFRILGADAVGMSTGIEAIAARQMGMRVCGLSCVTVPPSDASSIQLNEDVVNSLADAMTDELGKLLTVFVSKLKD
ncbi:MAG: purine-nucleoside phosphorylase [Eubacteriales bacterium]|nr:purine-nucleoside phosphorylase [Eubacteriales bacterium]